MGYTTDFDGTLSFTSPMDENDMGYLDTILGEDCREHPEWDAVDLTYVDFVVCNNGLQHNGSEKTYYAERLINLIITEMRKFKPDFGLSGALKATGEEAGDNWELYIDEDGWAKRRDLVLVQKDIKCPECGHVFRAEVA